MNPQETKSWGVGCLISGCSGCGCFTIGTAIAIGFAWMLWEVFDIREDWNDKEAAFIWGPMVGVLIGGLGALLMLFVGRWLARSHFFPDPPAGPPSTPAAPQ